MRTLYAIVVVFLLVSWHGRSYGQAHKLDSVRVEFEGFGTETPFDISCDDFSRSFKKTKKIKAFYNKDDLSQFELLKKDLKPTTEQSMDIRGQIIYSYGQSSNKYCFTVFGCFYTDGKQYYNKQLLMFISDKMYGDHPKYLDTLRQ